MGTERVGADAVVVAAGAWTAGICAELGIRLPVGPQRGQIVHAACPAPTPPRGRSGCPARTLTWSRSPPGGSRSARPGLTAGPWSGLAVALLALGEPPVTDLALIAPARFQA